MTWASLTPLPGREDHKSSHCRGGARRAREGVRGGTVLPSTGNSSGPATSLRGIQPMGGKNFGVAAIRKLPDAREIPYCSRWRRFASKGLADPVYPRSAGAEQLWPALGPPSILNPLTPNPTLLILGFRISEFATRAECVSSECLMEVLRYGRPTLRFRVHFHDPSRHPQCRPLLPVLKLG